MIAHFKKGMDIVYVRSSKISMLPIIKILEVWVIYERGEE
jgi:hypothetical protein